MADHDLLDLQRRWAASQTLEDEVALLRTQVRLGALQARHVALAGFLGHQASRATVEPLGLASEDPLGWIRLLEGFGSDCAVRLALAALLLTEARWRAFEPEALGRAVGGALHARRQANDEPSLGRLVALAPWGAIEDWLLCPCDAHLKTVHALDWLLESLLAAEGLEPLTEEIACLRSACWAVAPNYSPDYEARIAVFGEENFDEDEARRKHARDAAVDVAERLSEGGAPDAHVRLMRGMHEELVPWLLGRADPVATRVRARPAGAVLDPRHVTV